MCLLCAEFSWDDVKVDKHRENYLGHSIKAPVGRWQKGMLLSCSCPTNIYYFSMGIFCFAVT